MIATDAGVDLERLVVRGDPVRYHVEYDREDLSPSSAVVAALATVADEDPLEMPPLYESIDPDALDAVLETPSDNGRPVHVTIDIGGYEVAVTNDGAVDIDPPGTASLDDRTDTISLQ